MSYAWHQLQNAIKALARTSEQRECLVSAYTKLLKLKPRDLPAEVSADFVRLIGGIPRFPAKNIREEVRTEVDSLTDAEVSEAISLIASMHDAVAIYQPRAPRHQWASGGHA